jgi:hypothetical protein
MELSPSREAPNCFVTQERPGHLWNPNFHYRVHTSPSLIPNLSQINPVYTTSSCLSRYILILYTHLRLGLPSGLFSSGCLTNILYAFLVSPNHTTCPAHLILLIWSL